MANEKTGEAFVLVDLPQYGAKCASILVAPKSIIKALAADGSVDVNPGAVDAAKAASATVVEFDPEAAAAAAATEETPAQ